MSFRTKKLTRFMDWVMVLPDGLQERFDETIAAYEEERRMQYVTSFERIGMEKGRQQGLLQGMQQGQEQGQLEQSRLAVIDVLSVRFATLPPAILTWLFQCKELGVLHALHRQAVVIPSLAEFEALLRQMPTPRDA